MHFLLLAQQRTRVTRAFVLPAAALHCTVLRQETGSRARVPCNMSRGDLHAVRPEKGTVGRSTYLVSVAVGAGGAPDTRLRLWLRLQRWTERRATSTIDASAPVASISLALLGAANHVHFVLLVFAAS